MGWDGMGRRKASSEMLTPPLTPHHHCFFQHPGLHLLLPAHQAHERVGEAAVAGDSDLGQRVQGACVNLAMPAALCPLHHAPPSPHRPTDSIAPPPHSIINRRTGRAFPRLPRPCSSITGSASSRPTGLARALEWASECGCDRKGGGTVCMTSERQRHGPNEIRTAPSEARVCVECRTIARRPTKATDRGTKKQRRRPKCDCGITKPLQQFFI